MTSCLWKSCFSQSPKERLMIKHPVSWQKMQWIQYQKSEPFTILFKETLSEDMAFPKLDFKPSSKKNT